MVTMFLGALALLCWPSRPPLAALVGRAGPVGEAAAGPARGSSGARAAGAAHGGPGRAATRRAGTRLAGTRLAGNRLTGTRLAGSRLAGGRSAGRVFAGRAHGGRPVWTAAVLTVGAPGFLAGPAPGCAALLIGTTVAALLSSELRRRSDRRRLGQLLVATRALAREVRTGAGPVSAVLATAAAHPECSSALDGLAVGLLGRQHDPADPGVCGPGVGAPGPVRRANRRVDPVAEFVTRLETGWQMSARYGVPWASLIDTVTADLADREHADALRDAEVAGPRASGYLLAVLPALGLLLGAGMGADPVHVLLGTDVGAVLLLVGCGLSCLGLAWTASIVRP